MSLFSFVLAICLNASFARPLNRNRFSPVMQQVLDCDGSCKETLHNCIDSAADECMIFCGRKSKEDREQSGLNATIGAWFDCYTECAMNSAIHCFVQSSECLYECKVPQHQDPPLPPSPHPDQPGEEQFIPDEPMPQPPQPDMPPPNMPIPPDMPTPENSLMPPEMMGRNARREAMRHRMMQRRRPDMTGMCSSLSDFDSCCLPCYSCLSAPVPPETTRAIASRAECPPGTTDCDDDDSSSSDSLFFPGFGFPGFGFGGFPGFGGGFGFGGFPGFGFMRPGFGFGGFPGYGGGFGFGGFPRFGFGMPFF